MRASASKRSASKDRKSREATPKKSGSRSASKKEDKFYGKIEQATLLMGVSVFFFIAAAFSFTWFMWINCTHFDCSLSRTVAFFSNAPDFGEALFSVLPRPSLAAAQIWFIWLVFQKILILLLPGKIAYGSVTPAGHRLPYNINGTQAYIITHALFFILSFQMKVFPPTIIVDHHEGLFVVMNIYGFLLAIFVFVKAYVNPSHPGDRRFSGSIWYDFYMGIEKNPRIGEMFDFKIFYNARPGIIAWSLINVSFAAAQYRDYGYVTNSMILVNIFQAIYVVDLFVNEEWYLRTIDICHDHFGWMLAWGDCVFLPFMYTIQSHYLLRNPVQLSYLHVALILAFAALGYGIFRTANNQKDHARLNHGKGTIWGKKIEFISAEYRSYDGKEHQTLLLCSGLWGMARHFNYVGDLIFATTFCLPCGFNHLAPYFYAFFLLGLLLHRIERDHERCHQKYGTAWERYCKVVKYRLIPYVY